MPRNIKLEAIMPVIYIKNAPMEIPLKHFVFPSQERNQKTPLIDYYSNLKKNRSCHLNPFPISLLFKLTFSLYK